MKTKKKSTVLRLLRKTWDFLWNDDSILSWIANIVVAFILIKFIVYPGLGLVFGTQFPIVAVVSGSMEHDGTFQDWWSSQAICENRFMCTQEQFYSRFSIDKERFTSFDYRNGFNTGDIMVLFGKKADDIRIGNIIVFRSGTGEPIIHRVVNLTQETGGYVYQTKGDHNSNQISAPTLNELHVPYHDVLGKAVFRIPYLGWVKILFFKLISGFGSLINMALF